MNTESFIRYDAEHLSDEEMRKRASEFYTRLNKRRTVRQFSDKPVPKDVIEDIIKAAGTAPSGAHKQPWTFCVIGNPELKSKIRVAAEEEEHENYHGRMSEEWIKDLVPFGTDWKKPFLETAPWLIVVFRKVYDMDDGVKRKNYYVQESVGIACGMLLTAIHQAGLVSLTHTPSPMNFLAELLERPINEKPFLLIPVGHAADEVTVPDLKRKSIEDISTFY